MNNLTLKRIPEQVAFKVRCGSLIKTVAFYKFLVLRLQFREGQIPAAPIKRICLT